MSAVLETATRFYTEHDLERLTAQGYSYILIRGELREMPSPGALHGSTTDRLSSRVSVFVQDNDLGECFAAETGFRVEHDPDTVLAPDLSFVVAERLPESLPDGYLPIAPDLVMETRSPRSSRPAVEERVQLWLEAGVRLVWELDPKRKTLTVHRPGTQPRTLGSSDVISGEDVLPGFSLPMQRLFRPSRQR